MSLQIRRDTEENLSAITPLPGEPLWSTDSQKLFVGNGLVAGGIEIGGGGSGDGYTGSQGTQGFTGSQGEAGYHGSQGADGFTGSSGSLGFTGSQGDAGFTGSEGFVGSQGIQGFTGSAGVDGEVGFRGSQGDTGFTGSKGDTGFVGSKGDQGYNGSRGDQGFTGSQGVDGYVGSKGDSGEIGYRGSQGVDGYTGSKGDAGYAGSQGIQGFTGSKGDQGYAGSQGDAGYVGSRGDQGFTGSQGDLGYTGSQGVAGADGDRYHTTSTTSFTLGNSGQVTVYTVDLNLDYSVGQNILLAFDGANVQRGTVVSYNPATGQLIFDKTKHSGSGTYANWEINLDGAVGIQGFTGSQGDTGFVGSKGDQGDLGFTGSQGDQGYAGSQGYNGSQGVQGDIGFTGSKGDQGYDGSQGVQGYTGSQGDIGFTGSQGVGGDVGDVGFTGSKGDQGIQGEFGYTGSQGIEGYTGSQGYTGSDGIQGEIGFTGSKGDQGFTGSQGEIGFTGSRGALNSNQDLFTTSTVQFNNLILSETGSGLGARSIRLGNDSFIGDSNVANGLQIQGFTNPSQGWIKFGNEYPIRRLGRAAGTGEPNVALTDADNPLIYEGQFRSAVLSVGTSTTAFSLPTTDGTIGQVLATNGSGSVFWATNPGAQGTTGFTGSQGDLGYTGSQGTQGDQGFTGSQGDLGYIGSQGDLGYTGSQGDLGYTGSQGDVGFTGSQGDLGYTGSQGALAINYLGAWSESVSYIADDAVRYGGSSWIYINATTATGNIPYVGSEWWAPLATGINYRGAYSDSFSFYPNDAVTHDGSSWIYVSASPSNGNTPFVGSTIWQPLALMGYVGSAGDVGFTGSLGDIGYTGSGADTGDITFSGVKIQGAGTEGESGYATIELVPDTDLYTINTSSGAFGNSGGQYLIIDPTSPQHIHIRAGGPIDEAPAQLILGGEKSNVTVRNQDNSYEENHYVTVNTESTTGTHYSWIFGDDGSLTFPDSTVQTTAGFTSDQNLNTDSDVIFNAIDIVQFETDPETEEPVEINLFSVAGGSLLLFDQAFPRIKGTEGQLLTADEYGNMNWADSEPITDQDADLNTTGSPTFDIVFAKTFYSNQDTAGQQSVALSTAVTPFTTSFDGFNFTTTPSTTIPVIRIEASAGAAYKFMILAKDQYGEGLYRRHALEMLAIVDEDGYVFETGYAEIFSDGSLGTFSVEYIDAIPPVDPETDPGTPAYAQLNYTSESGITEVSVTVSVTALY
jgi:hypothetical protein